MSVSGLLAFPSAGQNTATAALPTQRLASFPANPQSQCGKINWCWAAVCQSVLSCFGVTRSQAEIVLQIDSDNAQADEHFDLFYALEQLNLALTYAPKQAIAQFVTAHCASEPVPISISWGKSSGHAICALGTDMLGGEPAVLIYDPQPPSCPSNGQDLIKLVTVAALGGSYLEADSKQARGRWVDACRVTGHAP